MCGIAGIIHFDGKSPETQLIRKMLETLIPRGPDEEGYLFDGNIALGIRRLSIIDIEGGKQPAFNEDKSIAVVFNGEVYNFKELREELEEKGHRFRTKSDTEVIPHLYEEEGEDFPKKINGMFAIALWDRNKKKLILCRDRAGEKPLYWWMSKNRKTFAFASELKALLKIPYLPKKLNIDALRMYLIQEYVPSPMSIIEDVRKLEPGHMLSIDNQGRIREIKYWDFAEVASRIEEQDEKELIQELDYIIFDSVKLRLRSDVPVGIFLSGGIDSSTIAYYVVKNGAKLKAFNISFEEKSFDELKYAKKVSEYLGIELFDEKFDEKRMLEALDEVIEFCDEPFADASILPTYLLSKITRRHVKVALTGDGGDELFGGYPTYIAHKFVGLFQSLPHHIRKLIEFIGNRLPVSFEYFSFDFKVKKFLEGAKIDSAWERHLIWMGAFWNEKIIEPIVKDKYTETKNELGAYISSHVGFIPQNLRDIMNMDFRTYLADDILFKTDRASMAVSLEARAPFLDPRIIETMLTAPEKTRVKRIKTKYILKKLMNRKLPEQIVNRPKKGFGIPISKWIATYLKDDVIETLKRGLDIFSPQILKIFDEHIKRKKDNRKKIWTVFMFLKWRERFLRE